MRCLKCFVFCSMISAFLIDHSAVAETTQFNDDSCLHIPPEISAQTIPWNEEFRGHQPQGSGDITLYGWIAAWVTRNLRPSHQSLPILIPLDKARVDTLSSVGERIGYTRSDGTYQTGVPSGPVRVGSDLESPDFRVQTALDGSGTRVLPNCQSSPCPNIHREEVVWKFTPPLQQLAYKQNFILADESMAYGQGVTEYTLASANAYVHTQQTIEWIRAVDPIWEPRRNQNIPRLSVTTNINSTLCNAYYDSNLNQMLFIKSTNLFEECPNTAYSTIIRHELGHAFVTTLRNLVPEPNDFPGFHEGVADTLSILSLDTHCAGLDFAGNGTGCFRDYSQNFYRWPVQNSSSHIRGMALAGAFWDLQVALKGMYNNNPQQGLEVSRNLFIKAMQRNDTGYDPGIGDDVLEADRELYPQVQRYSTHADLIRSIFSARGLLSD